MYDELYKRAKTIAPRYKGRFVEYDFNNEMVHGDYFQEKLGPGITVKMANWIPPSSLYRKDWTLTPVGNAYRSLVFDEWWTRYKGEANRDGYCIIRAFFGTHKIRVDGVEKTIKLSKRNTAAYIEF